MATSPTVNDLQIGCLADLFGAVQKAQEILDGPPIWWRGETSSLDKDGGRRRLVPEVFRSKDLAKRERDIFNEFCARAPSMHPQPPQQMKPIEWLCFMRHYRAPTRLLDWTESVLAAAFFATGEGERKNDDKEGVLWALHPVKLNRSLMFYSSGKTANDVAKNVDALKKKNTHGREVVAFVPVHMNTRVVAQSSRFTIHRTDNPLEEHERSSASLRKFRITSDGKARIREELQLLALGKAFFLGGQESLADDIKKKYGADHSS